MTGIEVARKVPMVMSADGSWRAFWPTLLTGEKPLIMWQHVAAILPPEHPSAGSTIVLSGGRTLDVVESREAIEAGVMST
jgi:hypothetical protein